MLRIVTGLMIFASMKNKNEIEGSLGRDAPGPDPPINEWFENVDLSPKIADVISDIDYKMFGDTLRAIDPTAEEPPLLVFALTLERLKDNLKRGNKVLDVSGWGGLYLSVCMALMVEETGSVVVVHANAKPLIQAMKERMPHFLEDKRILILRKNPMFGAPDHGPYDAIHAGPVPDVKPLLDQLKNGGRMLVPEDGPEEGQRILATYEKDETGIVSKY